MEKSSKLKLPFDILVFSITFLYEISKSFSKLNLSISKVITGTNTKETPAPKEAAPAVTPTKLSPALKAFYQKFADMRMTVKELQPLLRNKNLQAKRWMCRMSCKSNPNSL